MNLLKKSLLASGLFLGSFATLVAPSTAMAEQAAAGEPTFSGAPFSPYELAVKYDDVLRLTHTSLVVKFKLSTCKYRIAKKKMRCAERPRVRVFENVVKYFGRDLRSTALVLEPARDRGIGSLSYEYFDPEKDNFSWIYLSALGKVKRIIASRESEDSGSFFGSEFSIEDFEERRIKEYSFNILGEDTLKVPGKDGVETREAWILEWLPDDRRLKKSRYSRTVSWIDKERFILLKEDYYDHDKKHVKQRIMKNIQFIDNNWLARNVTMNNMATSRVSMMQRMEVALNVEINDEFLTQRTLTDFAFRERYLSKYRTYLKK